MANINVPEGTSFESNSHMWIDISVTEGTPLADTAPNHTPKYILDFLPFPKLMRVFLLLSRMVIGARFLSKRLLSLGAVKQKGLSLVMGFAMASLAPAAYAQTCSFGEPFDFSNTLPFTVNPANSSEYTTNTVVNGVTFDITVLDNSSPTNPIILPTGGASHNQFGGGVTDGGFQILQAGNSTPAEFGDVDVMINISGGIVTALNFFAHDVEEGPEIVTFGAPDYVTLARSSGATVGIDTGARTATGTAANSNGSGNRSAVATYENINGITSVTQNHTIPGNRLGTGFGIGVYCVSVIEAVTETFPAVNGGTGGTTTSVLASDTLNGVAVDPLDITLTPGAVTAPDGSLSTALVLNANGTITVAPGTLAGDYMVTYEICDNVNTGNCSTVTETVTITEVPSIALVKTLSDNADEDGSSSVSIGDTLTYTIVATNTGNAAQTNFVVTDNLITPSSNSCATVAAGGTCVLTGAYVVTMADEGGDIVNTASVVSDQVPTPVEDSVTLAVDAGAPSLIMTKVADSDGPFTVGDTVTYTYTVTNDGNVSINDIAVSDTHNGSDPAPIPSNETLLTDTGTQGDSTDSAVDGSWDVLAPGDIVTFTSTYTVTQTDAENL